MGELTVPRVTVTVMPKQELLDPQGQAVERALPALGFTGVHAVRIGKHIELVIDDDGDIAEQVEAMADQLLANPVIEEYTVTVHDT